MLRSIAKFPKVSKNWKQNIAQGLDKLFQDMGLFCFSSICLLTVPKQLMRKSDMRLGFESLGYH